MKNTDMFKKHNVPSDGPHADGLGVDTEESTSDAYSDIIDLPHHISTKHPQMSMMQRAAQFAPFAALTGHEDAIEETATKVMDSF